MKKVAIFVDVQNIYYTTRDTYGRPFNYRQFWFAIEQEYDIVAAYAYAIDKDDVSQQKFQSALRHIGFNVKLKPFIQRRDGSAKGDWDVGITIDVLKHAPDVDEVILLSGDGDFAILLDELRDTHQVSSQVFGVLDLTAGALIEAADEYAPIEKRHLL
ncbi:MAG: NYN domain-containing protein [Psychrobium sp.]